MTELEKKIYVFDKIRVFFKHTDYYGFVHPYNYYEWTSYVRENFFSEMCGDFRKVLNGPIKMMTAKIEAKLVGDSLFGDDIEARFTVVRIKRVSFDVVVRFYNRRLGQVVAETIHTLVYVDSVAQKFTNIPEEIRTAILPYQDRELIEKGI